MMSNSANRSRKTQLIGLQFLLTFSFFLLTAPLQGQEKDDSFEIKIAEIKTNRKRVGGAEALPVDPKIRVRHTPSSNMTFGLWTLDRKRLVISSNTARHLFRIDGQLVYPRCRQQQLAPGPRGKKRQGALYTWRYGDLEITQEQIIVPSTLPGTPKPGQKRKMDSVLFRYKIVNKGRKARKIGMRIQTDMYIWRTDGPVFWSPTTAPNKVLDGIALTGKEVPSYLIAMEWGNLKNTGLRCYFNFKIGRKAEKPSKLVLTRHGYRSQWEIPPRPIRGDSDIVIYWAEKKLAPGQTRTFSYGYGLGLASGLGHAGTVKLKLSGSFAPSGTITIRAYVADPENSQSLTLKLPKGIKLLEGKRTQPVPGPNQDNRSQVVWKGQVLRPGIFPISVVSSNGIVNSTQVTISKSQKK